ncbi:DUF177 domain containing protein [Sulfitobacter noctilucae]|uniref:YceD family protein n=1 Tax=Sulfitobacter noctilucae TaxID=1342302 RepID=UPI00056540C6|nr:DUF177 domain-containing protein [Sulfitobacter noctilucae]KIN61273.1 DUF177 domain containing protein [Sulfitobacter noctilucae]
MAQLPPSDTALRVSELSQTDENGFALRPEAGQMKMIADELDLLGLRKLSFQGSIRPLGATDWTLEAQLGATVTQPCVVTLEPVTTRIDVNVTRQFVSDWSDPDDPEVEMPEDDTVEPLRTWIDPAVVMLEALALAVPDYPRKDDAELGQLVYTKPGEKPMTDEDARPFAGLAALKDSLDPDKA